MTRAIRRTIAVLSGSLVVGALLVAVTAGPAGATVFSNGGAITVPAGQPGLTIGVATPYPSGISVTGLGGTITDVNVTLSNINHTWPDDIDALLVGPLGQKVVLMADVGGGGDVTGVTLTFDDAASGGLTDEAQIASGTFDPSVGAISIGGCCGFSGVAPAPGGPYATTLAAFNGTAPNGSWNLFVYDDGGGDFGNIANGWSLDITVNAPTITSFTPTSGPPGTSVAITGTNFTGATSVTFGGAPATFVVGSSTSITATVPAAAVTGPIVVTTPAGTATSATNFTVTPAPTITSFTPTSGKVGTPVTIIGTTFLGVTAVTFNNIPAVFVAGGATSLTATVPAGASTGLIRVTTPSGTGTSLSNFVVQHARDVDLNLTKKAKGVVNVTDGFAACASSVPVKLQIQGGGGGWQSVGSDTTNSNGSYNLGSVIQGERYRVLAKKFTTASGDTCLKDASPTVRA